MKKLIVITTGGTIGSLITPGSTDVDPSSKRIIQEIETVRQDLGCAVQVRSPLNKNSEALSPADWIVLLESLDEGCRSGAEGILVTHGTDTMVYSLAAVLAFGPRWTLPVCFTGSYYAPDHPDSDVLLSLSAAFGFLSLPKLSGGVYLAFRSGMANTEAHIHQAALVKPMAYDELAFASAYGQILGSYKSSDRCYLPYRNPGHGSGEDQRAMELPHLGDQAIPGAVQAMKAAERVALITLYPGISRGLLEQAAAGRDILIIQGYHCGTGPSDPAYPDLLEFLRSPSCPLVLLGTLPGRTIQSPYQSTLDLKAAGAQIVKEVQTHFLYVFSVLALAQGHGVQEIITRLKPWLV